MRFRSMVIGGLTLGMLLFQIGVAEPQESLEPHVGPMTRERFLSIFEAVVFGNPRNAERVGEVRWEIDGEQFLTKWTVPIRIAVFGAATDTQVSKLNKHAALLSELTMLPITVLDARNREDQFLAVRDFEILAIFSEINDFRALTDLIPLEVGLIEEMDADIRRAAYPMFSCIAWSFGMGLEEEFAITFIKSDLVPDEQSACIVEEITQLLGLPNDVDGIESVFNDDDRHKELTELDRDLVRALYDPAMKAGLPRDQAMSVLRQNLRNF
ncbi:MAG: DUF2927 domain-containing protein [Alphaproteobacteria bacterium]